MHQVYDMHPLPLLYAMLLLEDLTMILHTSNIDKVGGEGKWDAKGHWNIWCPQLDTVS